MSRYIYRSYPTGTGDFAPDAVLTPEKRRAVDAVNRSMELSMRQSIEVVERAAEIDRMTAVYAARRAAGLADNDAGMGRLAETETRNWRP